MKNKITEKDFREIKKGDRFYIMSKGVAELDEIISELRETDRHYVIPYIKSVKRSVDSGMIEPTIISVSVEAFDNMDMTVLVETRQDSADGSYMAWIPYEMLSFIDDMPVDDVENDRSFNLWLKSLEVQVGRK